MSGGEGCQKILACLLEDQLEEVHQSQILRQRDFGLVADPFDSLQKSHA
jgi:hypothetical protein